MTLKIEIDLDNDAFLYADGELERILIGIARAAQECEKSAPVTKVRDVNGNTVGRWAINDEERSFQPRPTETEG